MVSPNVTAEERNELLRLGLRQVLNMFPVGGPILTDILFEFRNNVKQQRLNHFISLLEKAFIAHDIQVEQLKTEEALDLLEQVIAKIAKVRSANKRVAFKNLLMRGIMNPTHTEVCEIFCQLLDELKEEQLQILSEHKKYLKEGQPLLFKLHALNDQFRNRTPGRTFLFTSEETATKKENLEKEIAEVKSLLEKYHERCNATFFGVGAEQYQYFLRDLSAKGLLMDQGVGTFDPTPLKYMGLTDFGLKFLEYVLRD